MIPAYVQAPNAQGRENSKNDHLREKCCIINILPVIVRWK